MERLEYELATLRSRAATLRSRHAAAEDAFLDADAKLQRHLLEADLDDDKVRTKLEAAVAACALTRDNFAKALTAQQAKVADAEQRLAAERAAVERNQASRKLAADLDAVEKALPIYLDAARKFTKALDELHHHFEATQMSAFVTNGLTQVEVASAFTLSELRATVRAVADGSAPIPAAKPVEAPVVVAEPPPPTMTVFMMRSAHFRDHEGKRRFAGQYEDAIMPVATAQKATRLGLAVSTADPRRGQLRGVRAGDYRADALDVTDIDTAAEDGALPYVGPYDSEVIASANFTELQRGPERTAAISVHRL
jgi:hypothetical protein